MEKEEAKIFFEKTFGLVPKLTQLEKSGSERINFIAEIPNKKYIITKNLNIRENESFFYFSQLFEKFKFNTPHIFSISEDRTLYIQSFLGEETLFQVIQNEGITKNVEHFIKDSLNHLHTIQIQTRDCVDYQKTYEYEQYDEFPIWHDLYYFKNFAVDVLGLEYHKLALLREFKEIVKKVKSLQPRGLMIRDFQSRNILVSQSGIVSFIDYQSAMKGPLMYDVISFLYQARANFPEELRKKMIEEYCSLFNENEREALQQSIPWIQLMRFLQVLGAYGLRGLIQKKEHFLKSFCQGVENLYCFSESWDEINQFPELKKIILLFLIRINKKNLLRKNKNISLEKIRNNEKNGFNIWFFGFIW